MKNIVSTRGFTMIEMLISISIFMVFMALSAGSYIGLMKANRDASNTQRIYRDVRHVFDTIADEAHNNQIDFNCFNRDALNPNPDPECIENTETVTPQVLAFIEKNNLNTIRSYYKFINGTVQVRRQTLDANNVIQSFGNWQPLTASTTTFKNVSFEVFPLKNPYDPENIGDINLQWQPSIRLTIQKSDDIIYRTTYSSRSYGTRSLYH